MIVMFRTWDHFIIVRVSSYESAVDKHVLRICTLRISGGQTRVDRTGRTDQLWINIC